ncbi:MAG TPA: hypothetical protein ENG60_02650 [Thermoplasmatales archaeon]|nr:hypothetical protein [Thermoplasmatales archaeon]HEX17295.1 hypothetical protein [Thermoplasmatales archaeon]
MMRIDPTTRATLLILSLLILGLLLGYTIASLSFSKLEKRLEESKGEKVARIARQIYIVKMVIIAMNIFLLLGLLIIYIRSFIKTSSSFMLGLSIFIGVMLAKSLISLPILGITLGIPSGFSMLGVLPNIFETLALIILFYLSME